jgi:hypothetical protein
LQDYLDAVATDRAVVPINHVYEFDQIVEAHSAMEAGDAVGKLVVMTQRPGDAWREQRSASHAQPQLSSSSGAER